ncbi:hypothetical protein MLD38_028754 [Melastoma candidum]|uniref:Uncharacterized protein n=1 Tax=Melastoma candidum TaxID=119954 RepID=A0ACB9N2S8_9MYRT|nr:hypothetical protein MLD38_028754 [Melastoma candidum]
MLCFGAQGCLQETRPVEESKKKFQAIQHANAVLSDANNRFMCDVGAHDRDDDDEDDQKMAIMMRQDKECGDTGAFSPRPYRSLDPGMCSSLSPSSSSFYGSYRVGTSLNNKRSSSEMSKGTVTAHGSPSFSGSYQSFCFGLSLPIDWVPKWENFIVGLRSFHGTSIVRVSSNA